MDYTIEAGNIQKFEIISAVLLPHVLFVSKDILEMEELDLISIEDLTPADLSALDQASGQTIAQALVRHRLMYTDPHAGQLKGVRIKVKGKTKVKPAMLDFGQVMEVDEKFLQSLYRLIFGVVRQEEEMASTSLKGLILFESAKKLDENRFYAAVGSVLKGETLPSAKIEKLLDLAASRGGQVTWELSEFIRMVLFWEGAMRENRAPHNNFIGVYLLPELLARFGGS